VLEEALEDGGGGGLCWQSASASSASFARTHSTKSSPASLPVVASLAWAVGFGVTGGSQGHI